MQKQDSKQHIHEHEQDQLMRLRQLNNPKQIIQVEHVINSQRPITQSTKNEESQKKDKHQQENSEGSQHGHQHNQNCSHSKKDKKKHKHRKGQINYGIIFYCIFTCVSCLYLEVFCFHPLQQNQQKRRTRSFFTILVVIMAQWSYYKTVTTKNSVKKLNGIPNIVNSDVSMVKTNILSKQCEHCKYYKTPRVSHCSTCGTCIMKLDHHCIWTQNCIGYRNQKSFYLFTMYMSIGIFQFWSATYNVFGKMYGSCKFFSFFQPGVYILWAITCFSALFIGLMIVALFFSHTFMIFTNHTTLLSMKQKRMCPLPFCQFRDMILQDQYINTYDRGQIQNIRSLFGTNIFLAFIPITRQPENDFVFQYPNPEPTNGQITTFMGGAQAQYLREQELKKTILKVKDLYKGQKFIINDNIIELN